LPRPVWASSSGARFVQNVSHHACGNGEEVRARSSLEFVGMSLRRVLDPWLLPHRQQPLICEPLLLNVNPMFIVHLRGPETVATHVHKRGVAGFS
jgi:hypothetical protein